MLVNGACTAWVARGGRTLLVYLPEDEPARGTVARALAAQLAALAGEGGRHGGLLVAEIDGAPAVEHPLAPYLIEAGFTASALGFSLSRRLAARA